MLYVTISKVPSTLLMWLMRTHTHQCGNEITKQKPHVHLIEGVEEMDEQIVLDGDTFILFPGYWRLPEDRRRTS